MQKSHWLVRCQHPQSPLSGIPIFLGYFSASGASMDPPWATLINYHNPGKGGRSLDLLFTLKVLGLLVHVFCINLQPPNINISFEKRRRFNKINFHLPRYITISIFSKIIFNEIVLLWSQK